MHNIDELDAIDHAILAHLMEDGRLSNVELAGRVGLTPAPCLRRVRRLEDTGVITGYRAVVNPRTSGRGFGVYMLVQITMSSAEGVDEFERTVGSYSEVTEIRRVYGEVDYIIRVDVADSSAYERFQAEKMYPQPGVLRVVSHPTMKTVKTLN